MRSVRVVPGVVLLFLATAAVAQPLAPGSRLDPISLEDQHGETRSVDASTRLVLFSRDMAGGKFLREALEDRDGAYLASHGTVYVADISGMPSLIARIFAIPRMRGRGYPMLLDRDGSVTTALPDEEGKATLLFLDGLRVQRVEHVDSAAAVKEAIEGDPAPAAAADEEGSTPDAPPAGVPHGAAGRRGAEAIAQLRSGLMKALSMALAESPEMAIGVCRDDAPALARAAAAPGVSVGRTSDRLRNPRNAPAPWMETWLAHYLASPDDREPRVVALEDGRVGRVEPITVQPPCLTCHGEDLSPAVAARLAELYPDDRARGYEVGDFRGLFWAEVDPAVAQGTP
jgi:hypothetical protein